MNRFASQLCVFTACLLFGSLLKAADNPADAEPWRPGADHPDAFRVLISPGVAPCVLHVNGLPFPLSAGTPLTARYDWDFGDPGSKYNTLTGFNAAHVFNQPGRFIITLKVTEETGVARTATATVVINPDRRRELFVSSEGSDRNVGTSPDAPFRTLDRAFKAAVDGSEILLRAGVTYTADNVLKVNHSDLVIGRYEEGPDPIVMLARGEGAKPPHGFISIDNKCDGLLIQHIVFDSPFAVQENDPAPKIGIDAIIARGRNITVRDCTFLNLDSGVNANGSPVGLFVSDCKAPLKTGLRAYLVWVQGSDFVCVGNVAANSTREHIVRLSGVSRALITANHFTNLDRRPADKDDYSKGTIEMHNGSYAYIANNQVTGGTIRVGPLGLHGEAASAATDWSVIENNLVQGTWIVADSGSHHVMIRNNIIRNDAMQTIQLQGENGQGQINGDVHILNNTVIDNGTTGAFLKVWGHVDGIELKNNLYIAPHLRVGVEGAAAVNINESDLSSFTEISHNIWPAFGHTGSVPDGNEMLLGNRAITAAQWLAFPLVKDDAFADLTVDEQATPASGSAAEGRAEHSNAVVFDYLGRVRSPHPSVGAIEVGLAPPTTVPTAQRAEHNK
jgi:PKD repeat protein